MRGEVRVEMGVEDRGRERRWLTIKNQRKHSRLRFLKAERPHMATMTWCRVAG